jgi:hypothetical protein
MTPKELAFKLQNREHGQEITIPEQMAASRDGLLVIFGSRKDGFEFRGAIDDSVPHVFTHDELGDKVSVVYIYTQNKEIVREEKPGKWKVTAVFAPAVEDYDMAITAEAPAEPFDIFDDGDCICRGAVVKIE